MEIVAALVVLTLIGLLFYAIREPEKWNWRRPAKLCPKQGCEGRSGLCENCPER